MAIAKPENEDAILPILGEYEQNKYVASKEAAERVAQKNPDMDTQIYTDYLQAYLNAAKSFQEATQREDGKPVDGAYVDKERVKAQQQMNMVLEKEYFTINASLDPEAEKQRLATNHRAMDKLQGEMQGEGLISRVVKNVYDEEKDGFQWAKIAGGTTIGLLGLLMGMQISGAAGGGYLGAIATIGLALAGMVFGAKLAGEYFPAKSTTPNVQGQSSPSPSPGQAQEPEIQNDVETVSHIISREPQNPNIMDAANVDGPLPTALANTTKPAILSTGRKA